MRKLKLETLQVESFETTGTAGTLRGTVAGNAAPDAELAADTEVSYCTECIQSIDLPCEPTDDFGPGCTYSNCFGDCSFLGCTADGCTVVTECCAV